MQKSVLTTCSACGADWNTGAFKLDCPVCGGGAMERNCVMCGGKCGNIWKKALLDTHDTGEAHWVGYCSLRII